MKERGITGERVTQELRAFYYDTAQAANAVAMASLARLAPTTQILLGSDYPSRTAADHVRGLATLFPASDLERIERGNALRLLKA